MPCREFLFIFAAGNKNYSPINKCTTMKKFYTNIAVALMAVLTMTAFTSCDEDADIAYDLDGIWQGTIIGDFYSDRYGTTRTDYDTEICFYQSSTFSRSGTGYEIDRESWSGHISEFDFDWTVNNGRIYISYSDGYKIVIRDWETYYMGNTMRFRGYFEDYYTGETVASFNLIKVAAKYSYAKNKVKTDSITITK